MNFANEQVYVPEAGLRPAAQIKSAESAFYVNLTGSATLNGTLQQITCRLASLCTGSIRRSSEDASSALSLN